MPNTMNAIGRKYLPYLVLRTSVKPKNPNITARHTATNIKTTMYCDNLLTTFKTSIAIITNADEILLQLQTGDFTALRSLRRNDPLAKTYSAIEFLRCSSCEQFSLITIKSVFEREDDEGKPDNKEIIIAENFIISPENYNMLKKNWELG